MNFSALTRSLLLTSACVVAFSAANAQVRQPTVFMLQFGSFETRDEANDKIKSIGTKHGALLTKYPPLIREITMPPDNLTVYRTQAGPLDTRESAQSVCSQLASQGDECYVVETAMNIPGSATAPAVQQAGIIPTDEKPTPARDPENLKTIEKLSKPVPEASKTAMTQAMDEAAAAPSQIAHEARPVPIVEKVEKEESFWSWMDGDDEEDEDQWTKRKLEAEKRAQADADANRAAPVDTVATQDMTPPPAPLAEMPAPQAQTQETAVLTPMPLQSMGSSAPPTPMPPAAAEAPPVNIVSPNIPEQPLIEAPQQSARLLPPPAPGSFQAPAPVMAPPREPEAPILPPQAAPEQPLPPADAQLGSQGLRMPPPPPPISAEVREQLSRGEMPMPQPPVPPVLAEQPPIQSGPAPVLAPVAPESTGTIASNNLPPVPFKKGVSVTGKGGEDFTAPKSDLTISPAIAPSTATANGDVQVGEAQRVPLSASQQAPVEQLPAKVVGVNEEPALADNMPPPIPATPVAPPSSGAIQKTLWAHVHYFPDQQAALSFWDTYRRAHPDFPVVRVRTTSSLVAQQSGDLRVSLRIGPFAQRGFIDSLCESFDDMDSNVECGAITDMGASANAYAPRDRMVQASAASARYANKIANITPGFWVQLGTYPSVEDAELAWEDATTQHSDALAGMKPAIVSPEQGSQSNAVFRLRTGPFADQMAAKDLCSRVKVNNGTCLVVSE